MTQVNNRKRELNMELANMRRNPYLVDYSRMRTGTCASGGAVHTQRTQNYTVVKGGRSLDHKNGGADGVRRNRAARQRARLRRARLQRGIVVFGSIACIALLLVVLRLQGDIHAAEPVDDGVKNTANIVEDKKETMIQGLAASSYEKHPDWIEDFLTPNEFSRPGDPLTQVNSIFVHYTANPGTSAAQNRSYFESLKDTQERSASAHFIIGYDGEIIQCIPLDEIAYAVQTRNEDSLSIECCYMEEDGSFTQETYDSLISLLGWLTDAYDLDVEDILRHYDCGGKKCPLYYTEHPEAWEKLKEDVKAL